MPSRNLEDDIKKTFIEVSKLGQAGQKTKPTAIMGVEPSRVDSGQTPSPNPRIAPVNDFNPFAYMLSPKGVVSRSGFFLNLVLIGFGLAAIIASGKPSENMAFVYLGALVVLLWFFIVSMVRRWRDTGQHMGWLVVLLPLGLSQIGLPFFLFWPRK